MRKKFTGVMLAAAMAAGLAGCSGPGGTSTGAAAADTQTTEAQREEAEDGAKKENEKEDSETSDSEGTSDFHVGVITGSVSRSEDDRRGAEAFQAMCSEDMVKLAIYPDNFTEELGTITQTIVNLSNDPKMKTVIMNWPVPGTTEALRKIKETRPDIFCITDEGHGDLPEVSSAAGLVCNNDFVACDYLIIRTAHELGCDTSVHISSPRHVAYEAMSRRVVVMKGAYKEFGMESVLETTPDPASDIDVTGAQVYILEKVSKWIEEYGKNAACFYTNDTHTEPLLRQLMEYGGYFIEADLSSLLMGYPGALGIDLTAKAGDFDRILTKVESTITERGGANHSRTWAYSYGYTTFVDLAQHALDVFNGESELDDIDSVTKAYQVFSPKAERNGPSYTNVETGVKSDNVFLVCQDTYIVGDPGHFMDSTKIEVPEKYFTIKQDTY